MRIGGAVLVACLCVIACNPTPPYYGVPAQHSHESGGEAASIVVPPLGDLVKAADPGAEQYFVRDVKPLEAGAFRWTLASPEFRFSLPASVERRKLLFDFGINERTLTDMGPLRMTIAVNGRPLDNVVLDKPGQHTYQKPVPAAWLLPAAENRVQVSILNPWPSQDPGVKLGVVMHAIGIIAE